MEMTLAFQMKLRVGGRVGGLEWMAELTNLAYRMALGNR